MMVFPGLSPGARSPINRGKPQSPRGVDTVDSALFAPQNIFHIFSLFNSGSFQIYLGSKTINMWESQWKINTESIKLPAFMKCIKVVDWKKKSCGGILSKLCKPTASKKVVAQMLRLVNITTKYLINCF